MFVAVDAYLSPTAQQDAQALFQDLLQRLSPCDAWNRMDQLANCMDGKATFPLSGRYRPDLFDGVYSAVDRDLVYYYRCTEDGIDVLSIGWVADDPCLTQILVRDAQLEPTPH